MEIIVLVKIFTKDNIIFDNEIFNVSRNDLKNFRGTSITFEFKVPEKYEKEIYYKYKAEKIHCVLKENIFDDIFIYNGFINGLSWKENDFKISVLVDVWIIEDKL